MAFEKHPVFELPCSAGEIIWRYMDFTKFVSMLVKRSLYFSNLLLLSQNDPFEGLTPTTFFRHRNWHTIDDVDADVRANLARWPAGFTEPQKLEQVRSAREDFAKKAFHNRKTFYVNCWHTNNYESPAMWSLYSMKGSGIAMTSTVEKIDSALKPAGRKLYAGKVRYTDYDTTPYSSKNLFSNVMQKRISYEYERELRVVFWDMARGGPYRDFAELEALVVPPGVEFECDLDLLVSAVYVSPASESWYRDLVESVMAKYGLTNPLPVKQSNLDAIPIHP